MVLMLAVVTCITAYVGWNARPKSSATRVASSLTSATVSESSIQPSTIKASSDSLEPPADDVMRVTEPVDQVDEDVDVHFMEGVLVYTWSKLGLNWV